MNAYQQEHAAAFQMVQTHLDALDGASRSALDATVSDYLAFRKAVNAFLERHFKALCTVTCYQSRLSACCTREGIVVFFADVVVNCMVSAGGAVDGLIDTLHRPNAGFKCIYLTETGCAWKMKPIVCQMFLCDRAERDVLEKNAAAKHRWAHFKTLKNGFTWPDRRVLFDDLERYFMDAGLTSSLMYFHKSPGLLRVKRRAGFMREP